MKYDREAYERLILHSPVFSLDKEKDISAYKREALKLVEYIYCYLLGINESKYEPYGYEITVVARRCIQNYTSDRGNFLHYFNAAWKKEFSHICSDQIHDDKFRGIHISEDDKRNIRRYKKYLQSTGEYTPNEYSYTQIAESLSLSVDIVKAVVEMADIDVGSTYHQNSDGEEFDMLDQLTGSQSIESDMESQETVQEILVKLDQAFMALQTRQQPIISDLLTSRLLPVMDELDIDIHRFCFISTAMCEQYKAGDTLPSQREIAQKYGRNEASISRTLKEFILKFKERM